MRNLRSLWQRLTGDWRHGQVGRPELWRMKRKFQVDFLRNQGLQPNHFLVDIGCGSLRGGIPLIDYLQPGHYTGIDVRESVLDEARRELVREKLAHKQPNLIQAPNLGAVNPGTAVDVFWAFSVLFHLSDAILADCISMVARHLGPRAFSTPISLMAMVRRALGRAFPSCHGRWQPTASWPPAMAST